VMMVRYGGGKHVGAFKVVKEIVWERSLALDTHVKVTHCDDFKMGWGLCESGDGVIEKVD